MSDEESAPRNDDNEEPRRAYASDYERLRQYNTASKGSSAGASSKGGASRQVVRHALGLFREIRHPEE